MLKCIEINFFLKRKFNKNRVQVSFTLELLCINSQNLKAGVTIYFTQFF